VAATASQVLSARYGAAASLFLVQSKAASPTTLSVVQLVTSANAVVRAQLSEAKGLV
jgi:hypothetical protein